MLAELSTTARVTGVKQSMRAVREGRAKLVFLACDADPFVTTPVSALCAASGVPTEDAYTMAQLGAASGISVGAAAAALLKTE